LPRAANPDFDPAELASPQMLKEGLDPLVAPVATLPGDLHPSERQIQVVVDNQDIVDPDAQRFRTDLDGFSAQVHESLGAKQKQFTILKSSGAAPPFKAAAQQPDSQRLGPPVNHHEAGVVTCVAISWPGVPQAYNQEQRGPAIQRAPLSSLLLGPPLLQPFPLPAPLRPSRQPRAVR